MTTQKTCEACGHEAKNIRIGVTEEGCKLELCRYCIEMMDVEVVK